jgi:hypothetical protein
MKISTSITAATLALCCCLQAPAVDAAPLSNIQVNGSLALEEKYSDNITYTVVDPLPDFITVLTPRLEVKNLDELLDLKVEGGVRYTDFAKHDEFDNTDYDFGGSTAYKFSELTESKLAVSYKKDSRIDQLLDSSGLLIKGLSGRRQLEGRFAGGHYFNEKTRLEGNYSLSRDRYIDQGRVFTYHQGGLTVRRGINNLSEETVALATLSGGYYDYEYVSILQIAPLVGFEKHLSESWALTANGGPRYTRTNYESEASNDETDWGVSGQLNLHRRGEYDKAELSFSHELGPRYDQDGGTLQRTNLAASYAYRWTQDLTWRFEVRYLHLRSDTNLIGKRTVNQNNYMVLPSISYAISDELRLDCTYDYLYVDYRTDQGEHLTRNQIVLRLTGTLDLTDWPWGRKSKAKVL